MDYCMVFHNDRKGYIKNLSIAQFIAMKQKYPDFPVFVTFAEGTQPIDFKYLRISRKDFEVYQRAVKTKRP